MPNIALPSIGYGTLAGISMLAAYSTVLTAVSGWDFAQTQFVSSWYFIVGLAVGFGIQVGLYAEARRRLRSFRSVQGTLGMTGATSLSAMIACCVHYLANLLPVLGTVGLVTFAAQYQTRLFWLALLISISGMVYMLSKLRNIPTV